MALFCYPEILVETPKKTVLLGRKKYGLEP
jgi:hypothetical protein